MHRKRVYMQHPRHFTSLSGFGLISLLAACSSYSAREAPNIGAAAMPYRHSSGPLSLAVDPYSQPSRQLDMFGEDLSKVGVLPVHVAVTNGDERWLRIAPENFKLELPGNEPSAPRPSYEVSTLLAPEIGVADYAAAGVGVLGGLGGTIGALAGRLVSFFGAAALDWSRTSTVDAREKDYERKAFKAARLGKNQSARGFLYFVLPVGTPDFDQAILTLSVLADENATLTLNVPLKGLGYKALPGAKRESEGSDEPAKPASDR